MPGNLTDAGVHGWPRELDGSSPRPATALFGVLPATTVYAPANVVWTWCEAVEGDPTTGAWQIIWAKAAALPVNPTATWVPNVSVRINWTLPAVNTTTTWVVRRTDGTEVGRVGGNISTILDPTPLISISPVEAPTSAAIRYRVAGVMGSDPVGSYVYTNTLNVCLDAATLTVTPSYPSAASNSAATVKLDWTPNATYGQPHFWRAWQGGWVGEYLPGSARSTVLTSIVRGENSNIRIVPFTITPTGGSVQAGNWSATANAPILPNVSQPQYWRASGTSRLEYGFWGPAAGAATDYELQYYISTWTAWATTTSGGPHYLATTSPAYARVRTRAPGGNSDWVQSGPAYPVNDATGPAASSLQSFQPEASWGRCVVRGYWPGDADASRGQIFFRQGGGWVLAWDAAISPGGYLALAWNFGGYGTAEVIVRTFDTNGNQGADAYAAYNLEPASQVFDPVDGCTDRGGVWRNDSVAGYYGLVHGRTSAGINAAYLFYGPGLQAWVAKPGRTVTSITLDYWRADGYGAGACISPGIWVHGHDYRPGAPPGFAGDGDNNLGGCVNRGSYTTTTLPGHFTTWFQQGWRGLVLYRNTGTTNPDYASSYYMKLGDAASGWYVYCGRVTVNSLG